MFIAQNMIELINGRFIKQESLQMNIITKTIEHAQPCPYLENLLYRMRKDARRAYINYLKKCEVGIESGIIVIIKLWCFIRSSNPKCYKEDDPTYFQIDVELRKQKEVYSESNYSESCNDFSVIIEDLLNQLNICFNHNYAKIEQKYFCNNLCFREKAAAIMVHEYAHLFEADIYLYSRRYIDKINPNIKLRDLWTHDKMPRFCYGIDDELVECENLVVVNNGTLENIIVDKKWANIYHTVPRGNGRIAFSNNAISMPRMRISQISFDESVAICNRNLIYNNEFLLFHSIKSAKLSLKDGIVLMKIADSEYISKQERIRFNPFDVEVNIFEIMNNVFAASKDNYHMVYPCGKNGIQLPCGVITPREFCSIKGENNVQLL